MTMLASGSPHLRTRYHLRVELENGRHRRVGEPSDDADAIVARAIRLADELGRISLETQLERRVDVMSEGGERVISLAIMRGGLDGREA